MLNTSSMAQRFEKFHHDNPRVYEVLVILARQWVKATGRRKLGIATLYERARWELSIATSDADYKLNNNWRAFYARMIMKQEADLAGLFDTRRSAADDAYVINDSVVPLRAVT